MRWDHVFALRAIEGCLFCLLKLPLLLEFGQLGSPLLDLSQLRHRLQPQDVLLYHYIAVLVVEDLVFPLVLLFLRLFKFDGVRLGLFSSLVVSKVAIDQLRRVSGLATLHFLTCRTLLLRMIR